MSHRHPYSLFVIGLIAFMTADCRRGPSPSRLGSGDPSDELATGFAHPPDAARPWAYWMWMDGNLDREGITADLEAMRAAGLGGVVICEVNVGVPRGPVEFMSPAWRGLFKHVVREAERLGLEVTLNAGPGWTGSGGPWVKPDESMQHIVAAAVETEGPSRFDAELPRPTRRPAFFGEGGLPAEIKKTMDGFYRDVAVLAFPTPAKGPLVSDIDEKALYVRAPYSSQPGVKPFLPAPAEFPGLPAGAAIDPARIIDLTGKLTPDGRLAWDVPDGRWTILRFGRTTTGANTRPAPVPGLGLECDKLDAAAFDVHYDAFVGALLREIGPRRTDAQAGWTTLHIDSWEMGAQNWTGAFREEFRRRRGYDLLPFLPAVTGRPVRSLETSERFLWDLRQTANELVLENHALRLKERGRRDGFRLSIEPYDMTPCADMTLGTAADVPMGEFWLYGFNTAHSVVEAAGIAHTNGRTIVAAESFTSDDREAWQAHPASMKALGDWAFTAGVNRIVFHRSQHQAGLQARPGMTMGPYGVHWERTQTWWDLVPAYHAYLSRCQFLLRRGLPVADVCFLVAEGAPHVFRPPASALRGDPPGPAGAAFDGCPPETLLAAASVKDGRIVFPDGMSYRVLVLPERETVTPALLTKVRGLVAAGATVIGPRPRKSPSLAGYPGCDAEVERLAAEVWGDCDGTKITEHAFGSGRVVWVRAGVRAGSTGPAPPAGDTWSVGAPPLNEPEQYGDFAVVTAVLDEMAVAPDFSSDIPLRWAHRRDGATEIYFVANPEPLPLEATATFRVSGKRPELWDALDGTSRSLARYAVSGGRTSVPLRFAPHQSFFVVFRETAAPASTSGSTPASRANFPILEEITTLDGPWDVAFDPKWGGPEKIIFGSLDDWSRRPEAGIRYYSGTATYTKMFDAPRAVAGSTVKSGRLWLDLGTVENIAGVRLNGRDLGVVWCDPWRVDITGAIKPEGNRLEIRVANLWPNRLIGDEREPADAEYARGGNLARWPDWLLKGEPRPSPGRLTFSTWKHYDQDSRLLPSGLLGPVRLLSSPSADR
ncbi:MAG: glycosyl hydrolase [Candidatus Aminicenantales bacterium]